jgi:hypothetical protein
MLKFRWFPHLSDGVSKFWQPLGKKGRARIEILSQYGLMTGIAVL